MEMLIKSFSEFLKDEKNLTKSTIQSYNRDVSQFAVFSQSSKNFKIESSKMNDVVNYLAKLEEQGKTSSTISRNLASIRQFYQYLVSINVCESDVTEEIELPKVTRKLPSILTSKEIDILLGQPSRDEVKGLRDGVMLDVLYSTGIRVSEMLALNMSDIDIKTNEIKFKKNNIKRKLTVSSILIENIKEYIENSRKKLVKSRYEKALFLNINGARLTRQGFWKIIKIYNESSNIKKEITPHTLRHSFAVHLVESGTDIKFLKELLGHSDISSTKIYVKFKKKNAKIKRH